MKRSYAETFFRHRLLLTAPVLIALVLSAGYGMKQPRKYIATATIWTDRRIQDDSTIGTNPGSDVPSAGQQALLTSLLASRSFMRSVAKDSPLAGEMTGPQLGVDLALAQLASTVSISTPGPQVMEVAVKQPTPELATGVATALVSHFIDEEVRRIKARATARFTYDKQQLDAADKALKGAQLALAEYSQTHPRAAQSQNQSDPAETDLVAALAQAQQQFAEASKPYNESAASLKQAKAGVSLEVQDPPNQAFPQSRKKAVIFSAAGGLIGGLSISLIALLLFMTRDKGVRQEEDLRQALGMRVVGAIDELPKRSGRRLALSKRTEAAGASPGTSS